MSIIKNVLEVMSYKRGHGTASEHSFLTEWLLPRLPSPVIDQCGNIWVEIGESSTLYCAHSDTVHRTVGRQKVKVEKHIAKVHDSECLGADDGAGLALLLHMIEAGKPGVYVFYRGEEKGGIGSRWSMFHEPWRYVDIKRAVAFDRRGYSDVITHQAYGRCCSDEFAEALSAGLNDAGLLYMPCDTGVFTDTANLVDLVPECTNVSCGYDHEHGDREQLDLTYLAALGDALLQVDFEALPTVRDPSVVEEDPWVKLVGGWTKGRSRSLFEDNDVEAEVEFDILGPEDLEHMLELWYEGDDETLELAIAYYLGDGDLDTGLDYVDMSRMNFRLADQALINGFDWLASRLSTIN